MTEAICQNCGKPKPDGNSGSMTSYFFQHKYCTCAAKRQRELRLSGRSTTGEQNQICRNCGKSRPLAQKAGSFTGYMFKELRCQCLNPKFSDSAARRSDGSNRTMTAERVKQLPKSALGPKNFAINSKTVLIGPGTTIGGTFKVESVIGEGGMGTVYLARHLTLQRQFALKVLAADFIGEQYWQRFMAEAKTLASLSHPNLVNVYDLGVHDQSVFYYSMDYFKGANLEDILVKEGPQSVDRTIDIFLAVLDGLAYAHRHGIVHRDIKPANIFLCQSAHGEEEVKILDFGIAKLLYAGTGKQALTAAGEIFGSPFYMSPEQCMGGTIDLRSDIYSVGCSIFETLTGYVPFEGNSAVEIGLMHQEKEPPLATEVTSRELPQSIDYVIAKCLAKLPRDRYQSAKELALDLERIKEGKDPSAYARPGQFYERDSDSEPDGIDKTILPVFQLVAAVSCLVILVIVAFSFPLKSKVVTRTEKTWPANYTEPLPSIAVSPLREQLVAVQPNEEVEQFLKSNPGFYSKEVTVNKEKSKVFSFPQNFSLGLIRFQNTANNSAVAAQGMVSGPLRPVIFNANSLVADYPALLKYFRNDDIRNFSLNDDHPDSGQIMPIITQWWDLHVLNLPYTPFHNADLKYIENLKQLRHLSIFLDKTDVAKFAQCKILNQITYLTVKCETNLSPLFINLSQKNALQYLQLRNAKLSAADFARIATFKQLGTLTLKRIPVKNADVEQLSALENLKILVISEWEWNADCVNILKKFKNLEELTLPDDFVFNDIYRTQIKLALPHLKKLVAEGRERQSG